jgi:hypothetical protein
LDRRPAPELLPLPICDPLYRASISPLKFHQ